jgi:hypothetical protein
MLEQRVERTGAQAIVPASSPDAHVHAPLPLTGSLEGPPGRTRRIL